MSNVFRQSSLDKLSSPDQLDSMLVVTRPMSWLALAAAAALAAVVVIWSFTGSLPTTVEVSGFIVPDVATNSMHTPYRGVVSGVYVHEGDHVKEGSELVAVSLEDGEEAIATSWGAGVVDSVLVREGDRVAANATVLRYSSQNGSGNVFLCFVPYAMMSQIAVGMKGQVTLPTGEISRVAVAAVDDYVASQEDLDGFLDSTGQISSQLVSEGPVIAVTCAFEDSELAQMPLLWKGPASVRLFLDESAPISRVFPVFGAN